MAQALVAEGWPYKHVHQCLFDHSPSPQAGDKCSICKLSAPIPIDEVMWLDACNPSFPCMPRGVQHWERSGTTLEPEKTLEGGA